MNREHKTMDSDSITVVMEVTSDYGEYVHNVFDF